MASIENVEWLNQNLLRSYPLREDSNMTPNLPNGAVATGLTVPTCLITDFTFTIPFDEVDGAIPSLTGISHAGDGFSVEISLGDVVLTAATVAISEHTINKAYPLLGQGDNKDCRGWIVFGDLARAADELPEGVYVFAPGQIPFEVSTLRMAPRCVRSISAVGKYGLRTYKKLYGNVKLIAGSDMKVRTESANNAIWLQAESGAGYERSEACDCGRSSTKSVRSINGMTVADIQIIGDGECVSVSRSGSDIKIKDSCATPCCGCNELNFVNSAIQTINTSIKTLQSYASELQRRLSELALNEVATNAAVNAYPDKTTED